METGSGPHDRLNCVVLKPAEQTPLSALRLGELMLEAGLPAGVVNIVTGFGETAGAALAAHEDVDKVAFTGSTEVGRLIVRAAAGNLKKVSLELGGKSPNIVFKDAGNLESAIAGAANAIFFNHGQCCCAGSRLLVEEKVFDKVVEGVSKIAGQIKVKPGFEPDSDMGPLVSEEQMNRVCGYLDPASGRSNGGNGGSRHGDRGYFVKPTVLVNTNDKMKVVQEEIFGPVVTAIPFKDPDEIVARANDTIYGLAAGVWSRDIKKAHPSPQNSAPAPSGSIATTFSSSAAVWRIQAVRLGPRNGPRSARELHGSEISLRRARLKRSCKFGSKSGPKREGATALIYFRKEKSGCDNDEQIEEVEGIPRGAAQCKLNRSPKPRQPTQQGLPPDLSGNPPA